MNIYDVINWSQNKTYNPKTKRYIKINCAKYKLFEDKYHELFPNNYSYIDSIEDRDPISFEIFWIDINGIKKFVYPDINNLIMYKDTLSKIHCFEKQSLEYMKHYNIDYHPSTMDKLPSNIFDNITVIPHNISISDKAKNVFNLFTNISIFIDSKLFMELTNLKLDKLYYETRSFYHENLSNNIKNELNIFITNINNYNIMTISEKQLYILECYEKLIRYNLDLYILYYIIIGGLSTVIPKIKELYPDIVLSWS